MTKRAERSTSSSPSMRSPPALKRNKLHGKEMVVSGISETPVTLVKLLDKLNDIDSRMEDHFGGLQTEMACLRCKLKADIKGVKRTIKEVEKLLEAAWDAISDIQEELKARVDLRKNF